MCDMDIFSFPISPRVIYAMRHLLLSLRGIRTKDRMSGHDDARHGHLESDSTHSNGTFWANKAKLDKMCHMEKPHEIHLGQIAKKSQRVHNATRVPSCFDIIRARQPFLERHGRLPFADSPFKFLEFKSLLKIVYSDENIYLGI